jgi:hypothetical protein
MLLNDTRSLSQFDSAPADTFEPSEDRAKPPGHAADSRSGLYVGNDALRDASVALLASMTQLRFIRMNAMQVRTAFDDCALLNIM